MFEKWWFLCTAMSVECKNQQFSLINYTNSLVKLWQSWYCSALSEPIVSKQIPYFFCFMKILIKLLNSHTYSWSERGKFIGLKVPSNICPHTEKFVWFKRNLCTETIHTFIFLAKQSIYMVSQVVGESSLDLSLFTDILVHHNHTISYLVCTCNYALWCLTICIT